MSRLSVVLRGTKSLAVSYLLCTALGLSILASAAVAVESGQDTPSFALQRYLIMQGVQPFFGPVISPEEFAAGYQTGKFDNDMNSFFKFPTTWNNPCSPNRFWAKITVETNTRLTRFHEFFHYLHARYHAEDWNSTSKFEKELWVHNRLTGNPKLWGSFSREDQIAQVMYIRGLAVKEAERLLQEQMAQGSGGSSPCSGQTAPRRITGVGSSRSWLRPLNLNIRLPRLPAGIQRWGSATVSTAGPMLAPAAAEIIVGTIDENLCGGKINDIGNHPEEYIMGEERGRAFRKAYDDFWIRHDPASGPRSLNWNGKETSHLFAWIQRKISPSSFNSEGVPIELLRWEAAHKRHNAALEALNRGEMTDDQYLDYCRTNAGWGWDRGSDLGW